MENLKFEELTLKDITREYLDILAQLSPQKDLSHVSIEDAKKAHIRNKHGGRINYILKRYTPTSGHHFSLINEEIIGAASIIFDHRILSWPKCAAHVEDVCIRKDLHGFGYGRILMDHIKEAARAKNAYKLILSCAEYNIKFYKKCGYMQSCATMRKDFDEDYPVIVKELSDSDI